MPSLPSSVQIHTPLLAGLAVALLCTGCGRQASVDAAAAERARWMEERDEAVRAAEEITSTYGALFEEQEDRIKTLETDLLESDRLLDTALADVQRLKELLRAENEEKDEPRNNKYADVVRLRDGKEIRCKVLDLQGTIVQVQTPDGALRKARLSDVDRVLLRVASGFHVPVSEPPDKEAAPVPDTELALSPFWNIPQPASSRAADALRRLLGKHGRPVVDRTPRPGARLFRGIEYLMPLDEARAILKLDTTPRRTEITTPGLPKTSLYAYEYDGVYENRFTRMLLVTDTREQVVAVQLVDDAPIGRWIDEEQLPAYSPFFDPEQKLYNLFENRLKSSSQGLIGTRVEHLGDDVLRIDCEFLSSRQNPRECTRVYIAQPVVDLILWLLDEKY